MEKNINKKIVISLSLIILLTLGIFVFLNFNAKTQIQEIYVDIPEGNMEVGDVGTLQAGETLADVNPEALQKPVQIVPRDVFGVSGVITAVQGNNVIIRGDGSNFDDHLKRDLTIVIDENTKINGEYVDFKKALKVGDEIVIEAPSNIHGKTEFLVRYINVINQDI